MFNFIVIKFFKYMYSLINKKYNIMVMILLEIKDFCKGLIILDNRR